MRAFDALPAPPYGRKKQHWQKVDPKGLNHERVRGTRVISRWSVTRYPIPSQNARVKRSRLQSRVLAPLPPAGNLRPYGQRRRPRLDGERLKFLVLLSPNQPDVAASYTNVTFLIRGLGRGSDVIGKGRQMKNHNCTQWIILITRRDHLPPYHVLEVGGTRIYDAPPSASII
ncbi:hypothetical protein CRG98_005264 [Punica granatum]|uniref:Uncharacterized protein n=1 Tax=Punica granatum TaxID=22663 RepID=A0A2I0L0Z3_PUNGR|nr:hypothetical protein CRG98_005264 [Punica granatum]